MKKTITIEEIKTNPNLDLTERIRMLESDGIWSSEQLEDLAIASIKQEYEFWMKNRENISSRTDNMLTQILNGHILSKSEEFEMMCDEEEKIEQYTKYEELKEKVNDNNGITLEDFYELCKTMGLDETATEQMRIGFENKGIILDSYEDKNTNKMV